MKKLIKDGTLVDLTQEEWNPVFDLVFNAHSDDVHYLAFDRQLGGFSPLGTFVGGRGFTSSDEQEIFAALLAKKECCSLYPKEKLTLYPLEKIDMEHNYWLDLANIDKHFADICKLNDEVYKTKKMFVDFGHIAENLDKELIVKHLVELLRKSKMLEEIYIEEM